MPRAGEEIDPEPVEDQPPEAIPHSSPLPLPQPSPISESTVNQVAVSPLPGAAPAFSTVVFNPPDPQTIAMTEPVEVQAVTVQPVEVVALTPEAEVRPVAVTFQGSENGVVVVPAEPQPVAVATPVAVTPVVATTPVTATPVVTASVTTPVTTPIVTTPVVESGGLPTPSVVPATSEAKPEPIPTPMLRSHSTHTSKPFTITPLPNAVSYPTQRHSPLPSSNYSHGYSAIPTMRTISQRGPQRSSLNLTPTMKSTRSIRNSQKTENSAHTPVTSPVEARPEDVPHPVQLVQPVQPVQPVQTVQPVTPLSASKCVVIDDADFSLTNEVTDSAPHTPIVLPVPVMDNSEPVVVIPEASAVADMDGQNRDDFGKSANVEFGGIQQLPTVPSGLPSIINADAMESE